MIIQLASELLNGGGVCVSVCVCVCVECVFCPSHSSALASDLFESLCKLSWGSCFSEPNSISF